MSRALDKFSKLDQFHRELAKIQIDVATDLDQGERIIQDQIQMFRDSDHHNRVLHLIQQLRTTSEELESAVEDLDQYIYGHLRKREVYFIRKDYERYERGDCEFTDQQLLEYDQHVPEEFRQIIYTKINSYSDWRFPSVDLNPLTGRYTRLMVAGDPLYAITHRTALVEQIKKRFNQFYSTRRLRVYPDVGDLPNDQIGFALCVNKFEFWPLDPIKDFCASVYEKLRPGGRFILTYNDCEQRSSLEMLFKDYRCYNTRELMSSVLYGLGYNIVDWGNIYGVWNWMEVHKPGSLASHKQSSAEILFDDSRNK